MFNKQIDDEKKELILRVGNYTSVKSKTGLKDKKNCVGNYLI